LALDAHTAVRSYLGLSMSVSRSDPLFTVTYLTDAAVAGDIATSLRLTLPGAGGSRVPAAVSLTLYAGTPGAFVDLAADLAWLTARPLTDFVLDQHLAIPAGSHIGTHLAADSVINQAIGVLIGRGYTPSKPLDDSTPRPPAQAPTATAPPSSSLPPCRQTTSNGASTRAEAGVTGVGPQGIFTKTPAVIDQMRRGSESVLHLSV